jgi:hypothetical protein
MTPTDRVTQRRREHGDERSVGLGGFILGRALGTRHCAVSNIELSSDRVIKFFCLSRTYAVCISRDLKDGSRIGREEEVRWGAMGAELPS